MILASEASGPEKAGFEVPPPSVPDKEIKETLRTDVVVVGAGIAGLTAALSAVEVGAKTVVLEKGPAFNIRGLHNAAISSQLQKKAGIKVDRDQVIATIMEFSAYKNNQRLVTTWADNCSRVIDWLINMAEAAGIKVLLDPTTKPWYFPNYPVAHVFLPKNQETLAEMLQNNARARGVDFHFLTPAERLLRKENGRVTGIIARSSQGDYIRFEASRGVVLCTGDYGSDRQMVARYCEPRVSALKCAYESSSYNYERSLNTGDGHKMGLWVGAAIDDIPHCAMIWDWPVFMKRALFNLARQPWLYVNLNGERFMNEDLPWGYEANQIIQQPYGLAWSIWDAKWDHEWLKMQSQCCKNMGPPTYLWDPKQLDEAVRQGNVLTAHTIEGLAQKMELPVEPFRLTVARYNELARKHKDLDFGKYQDRLTTIEKPLFYACKMEARYMVILGGLKVNTNLQVIDTDRKVIPGLYAAGNVSGSFFGNVYPTTVPGLTHSRAWTFGRLAGLNAAGENGHGR